MILGKILNRSFYFLLQNSYFINFSIMLSGFYLIISFIDCMILSIPNIGDEWFFTRDLIYYTNNGYQKSVIHGISIPFTIISNMFYHLTNNISLSLRLTGSLFTLILVLYILFRCKIFISNRKLFLCHFFLLIGTTAGTFYGTNDSIFFTSFLIFVFESTIVYNKSKINILLLVVSTAFLIMSRPVAIVYLSIFFFGNIIFKVVRGEYKISIKQGIILPCFILGLVITLFANFPRFSNGIYKISYADKSTTYKTDDAGFNWTQWAFYSQLVGNKKRFGFFPGFVNWKGAKIYKEIHGESSLPKTYYLYLVNHTPNVIRRSITSIIEISLISIRYVGILLILLPFYFYQKVKYTIKDKNMNYAYTIIIGVITWAIIWPLLVQHRWLYPFYVLLIFMIFNDEDAQKDKYFNNILLLNMFILNAVTIWALWKWGIFRSI